MKEKLAKYLKDKYNPTAIILHGSRTTDTAREHSDWDFFLLLQTEDLKHDFREVVEGQNLDVSIKRLPVLDIPEVFGAKLQNAEVLYEKNNEGTELLRAADTVYKKGFEWPNTWPEGPDLWMQGRIEGMRDYVDNPPLFYKYFCQLYPRLSIDWFRVLHHQFPKPEYSAFPEIQQKDPQYYELLVQLTNQDVNLSEKVRIAEELRKRLFLR